MKEALFHVFLLVPFFIVIGLGFYAYSHIFYFLFSYLKPLSNRRRDILANFSYYKKLSFKKRLIFENRIQRFISLKEFIPQDMPSVTQEMQVMIAASAVQLTFGLPEVQLADFDKIFVHPTKYFSKTNRQYHTGEVNPRGIIVLSWEAFKEGYKDPNDGYNLGLHEMAHALTLEDRSSDYEENIFDKVAFRNWKKVADNEFISMKKNKNSYLRRYAFSDREEFFPVCIEYFFERSQEFKREKPELYQALSKLLNQDPSRC
jgi:MtfA peptidase